MNERGGLTVENMMRLFPPVLERDKQMKTAGTITAETVDAQRKQLVRCGLYNRIDQLEEEQLDILAKDLNISWYDVNYTLAEKRRTVKDGIKILRRKGTLWAVETGLRAVYPDTVAEPWWKYSGEPYHFRLLINSTFEAVDSEKHRRVMERLECYKSERDVLDEIEYRDAGAEASVYIATACVGCEITDGAVAVRY